MTITAMWSSEAFLGVPGGDEGFAGVAGVAGVGVGGGVGPATGVRWVHAPSAMTRRTMPLQAVARRRSVMEQFPSPVDEPVPDELVVLRDAGGRHPPLQAPR